MITNVLARFYETLQCYRMVRAQRSSVLTGTIVVHVSKNSTISSTEDLTYKLSLPSRYDKSSSGDEIANVNFFYNIAHVEASAYAH